MRMVPQAPDIRTSLALSSGSVHVVGLHIDRSAEGPGSLSNGVRIRAHLELAQSILDRCNSICVVEFAEFIVCLCPALLEGTQPEFPEIRPLPLQTVLVFNRPFRTSRINGPALGP